MEKGRSKNRNRASALVRGGEKFVKIVANIVGAVREVGGSEEDLDRLDKPGSPLLIAIARLIREPEAIVIGDPEERLVVAMYHAGIDFVGSEFDPTEFASTFGEVGDGWVQDHPPFKKGWDWWTREEIDAWLADKAKEGLEPAMLADGLASTAPTGETIVFWGSVTEDGKVPAIERNQGSFVLNTYVCDRIAASCSFLLRKAKKPAAKASGSRRQAAVDSGPKLTDLAYWRKELHAAISLSGSAGTFDVMWSYLDMILARLEGYSGLVCGAVGEGHMLARPPESRSGTSWSRQEIMDWIRGPEVFGKGLQITCIADGLRYLADNIDGPDTVFVVWGGELKRDVVAAFQIYSGCRWHLYEFPRDGGVPCDFWFLLCKREDAK